MNPIHDNNGNLLAVEMNGSRISAEALARMAATNERHHAALEAIANARVCDPAVFAQAILDGKSVQEATEADLTWLETPPPPEVAVSLLRIDARREVVAAALALHDTYNDASMWGSDPALTDAKRNLFAACNVLMALGVDDE